MKAKVLSLMMVCLALALFSCQKDENLKKYDGSKITVTVEEVIDNAALIDLTAEDVNDLGDFILGVCYSTDPDPTINDEHSEETVDSESLTSPEFYTYFIIEELTPNTNYNIKGYIKSGGDVYYSANKSFKTADKTMILDVYNYIPSGKEYWVVLSNKSTTILTQKIENNEYYIFTENIPALADIHIFKWDPVNKTLFVESYADIVPDEFYLENPYSYYIYGQSTVTISDLSDFLGWGVGASWWWNSTTTPATTTLSTYLSKDPDDLFIYYLPSSGSAPKYKVVNSVSPNSNYTYTMADFTEMTNFVNITLPDNKYFYYALAGFNYDYYTEFKKFHTYSYENGYSGDFKLYYPPDINTNYYLYAFYNTASTQSFYNKIGSMPTTFFTDFPTITIDNSSQFSTVSSTINDYSAYEVMDFCGYRSDGDIRIQWDYYKKPEASNSIHLPDFPAELKAQINNISTSDLLFSDVGYFDILNSPVTSYETYVEYLVKDCLRFYDVVKERRYYFQWVNKKSQDITIKSYQLQESQKQ